MQGLLHKEANPEPHFLLADLLEAACFIETLRMGISYDMKHPCSGSFGSHATVLHQRSPYTLPPKFWLNKKRIQLGISVAARKNSRESHN